MMHFNLHSMSDALDSMTDTWDAATDNRDVLFKHLGWLQLETQDAGPDTLDAGRGQIRVAASNAPGSYRTGVRHVVSPSTNPNFFPI